MVLLAWLEGKRTTVFKKIIWGDFSVSGKTELVVIKDKQNSVQYISVLEENLVPFLPDEHDNNTIFHQNDVDIRASKLTKD